MPNAPSSGFDLVAAARRTMIEHGFEPDFPPDAQRQLQDLKGRPPQVAPSESIRDLRTLLWSSIDNDTSRDLDQSEVAQALPSGDTKIMVAIADVDAYVPATSPIDVHAGKETTTVYTGVQVFPMLPEELSTGLTSLNQDSDRLSMVTEFIVSRDGLVSGGTVYRALTRNHAQLTYSGVGAWLETRGPAPARVAQSKDLELQLRLQDAAAQALRTERHRHGALNIDSVEVQPVMADGQVTDIARQEKNRATELIEDFMIAANGVVARMLDEKHVSSIRRIVKTPKRWDRIVALAAEQGGRLPAEPDAKALNEFLCARQKADPDHFPDLSLAVVKLMGPGEYVLERPGDPKPGHFGLAVQDYTHSTAPNRRYADLITQRLLKAAIANARAPYADGALEAIATACTTKEDDARRVEREMTKRISAVAMSRRIGQVFDAIVTGVTPKGTFVRVLAPHVEGILEQPRPGIDVGDRISVRLVRTDVEKGYIDFRQA